MASTLNLTAVTAFGVGKLILELQVHITSALTGRTRLLHDRGQRVILPRVIKDEDQREQLSFGREHKIAVLAVGTMMMPVTLVAAITVADTGNHEPDDVA